MNHYKTLCLLSLMLLNTSVWAYGSSSSSKACEKPRFTEFTPADKTTVAAQSAFSFEASSITNPKSIVVTIKQEPVTISVTPKNVGYLVQGKLPVSIKNTAARVTISAESPSGCKASDGWLVNVTE
ncbi:MAG: hypothetical protein NTV00_10935 [Methylococcales bacterium]|nr:hypothetical protein [Methylococcales bacterium]